MSILDGPISAAVDRAWKIAATVARRASSEKIEVHHFLFGIFSLDPAADLDELPPEVRTDLLAELAHLQALCQTVSVDFQYQALAIQRSMSLPLPSGRSGIISRSNLAISRSNIVREAFERAASPDGRFRRQIRLTPLLRSLIETRRNIPLILDLDPNTCSRLLALLNAEGSTDSRLRRALPDSSSTNLSIVQSIDGDQQLAFDAKWKIAGWALSSLCELSWRAGATATIETLFEQTIALLEEAIPAAEQAAIMTIGQSGKLVISAQFPKSDSKYNFTSASMAIRQRRSFIWQRGEDLADGQQQSDLRAGVYAPLLADGEVFGVLCLDAAATAGTLTDEDLFIVTSFGRQLGMTMGNRGLGNPLHRTAAGQQASEIRHALRS